MNKPVYPNDRNYPNEQNTSSTLQTTPSKTLSKNNLPAKADKGLQHVFDCQMLAEKSIMLRVDILVQIKKQLDPYLHESLRSSITPSYEGQQLILMVRSPALAQKIKQQQAFFSQMIYDFLQNHLHRYLLIKKQLHLLPELLEQFMPQQQIKVLIHPF